MKKSAAKALKEHLQEIKLFDKPSQDSKSILSPSLKASKKKLQLDDSTFNNKSSQSIPILSPHYLSPKNLVKVASIDISNFDPNQKNRKAEDYIDISRASLSFSPGFLETSNRTPDISSLPLIYSPQHRKMLSASTLPNDMSFLSPGSSTSLMLDMNNSEYIRQSESLSLSPAFSKFSKASSMLSKIEAKKSSLSKELFYYPEQIEVHNKLQSLSPKRDEMNQDEIGIINISEGSRQEVNLIEGRNAHFRLICYKKMFPVKGRVDLFTGSFEIRVSKSRKKPDVENYDFLFTTNSFDVDYKNSHEIKYLYFTVTAKERLRINLSFKFKAAQKPNKSALPSLIHVEQRERLKKKNIYEFFNKNMSPEEVLALQKMAEQIKEDKQKKAQQAGNLDLTEVNQFVAGKYDMIKSEHLVNLVRKREIRQKLNKQNRDEQTEEKLKRFICGTYRDDIRKLKAEWKIEMDEQKARTMEFQKDFLVTMALEFICREMHYRKTALKVVKLIKARIDLRVRGIQRAMKVFMRRPICIQNVTEGKKQVILSRQEGRLVVNIYHAMNTMVQGIKQQRMKKVETVVAKALEDWALTLKIRAAVARYIDKVTMVQERWKNRKENALVRLNTFSMHWESYCRGLVEEEKSKTKKPNSEMIKKITKEKVTKYGEKFVKDKSKAFLMAFSIFMTLQKKAKAKLEQKPNQDGGVSPAGTQRTVTMKPRPKLEINPTQDELKGIFDNIIQELKTEQKI